MAVQPRSVEIAWLKEHPCQHDFFAPASESELMELAADLESRGQQEPIHCTADGTIIRGHRRIQCACRLGWATVDAIVHVDIEDAADPEVVNDLILDNYMRQQLDDIVLARCYRQLKKTYFSSAEKGQGDVRDRLAVRLNCGKSGRSLDRLERLLELPRGLQDAISRGHLTKSHGDSILRLPAEDQAEIEQRLGDGEQPSKVLEEFGVTKTASVQTPADVGQDLLKFFQTNLSLLEKHIDQLDRLQTRGADVVSILDKAVTFMEQWRNRKKSLREKNREMLNFNAVGFRDLDNSSGTYR